MLIIRRIAGAVAMALGAAGLAATTVGALASVAAADSPIAIQFNPQCDDGEGAFVEVQIDRQDGAEHLLVVEVEVGGVVDQVDVHLHDDNQSSSVAMEIPAGQTGQIRLFEAGVLVAKTPLWLADAGVHPCVTGIAPVGAVDPVTPTVAFSTECVGGGGILSYVVTNHDGLAHDLHIEWKNGDDTLPSNVTLPAGGAPLSGGYNAGFGSIVQLSFFEGGDLIAQSPLYTATPEAVGCLDDGGPDPGTVPPTIAFDHHCVGGGAVVRATVTSVDLEEHHLLVTWENSGANTYAVLLPAGTASIEVAHNVGAGSTPTLTIAEKGIVLGQSPAWLIDPGAPGCAAPAGGPDPVGIGPTSEALVPEVPQTTVPATPTTMPDPVVEPVAPSQPAPAAVDQVVAVAVESAPAPVPVPVPTAARTSLARTGPGAVALQAAAGAALLLGGLVLRRLAPGSRVSPAVRR